MRSAVVVFVIDEVLQFRPALFTGTVKFGGKYGVDVQTDGSERMKRIALVALLALAACASTAEVAANHEAKCAVLSDSPQAHADCLSRLAQVHRRDQQRAVAAFIFAGESGQGGSSESTPSVYSPMSPATTGVMCFHTSEYTSGFNKICTYDCLGSAVAVTQSSVSLCPISIQH